MFNTHYTGTSSWPFSRGRSKRVASEEKWLRRKKKFVSLVPKDTTVCRDGGWDRDDRRSFSFRHQQPGSDIFAVMLDLSGTELPRNFQSPGNYTSSRLPGAFSRSSLCTGWHRYGCHSSPMSAKGSTQGRSVEFSRAEEKNNVKFPGRSRRRRTLPIYGESLKFSWYHAASARNNVWTS